MRDNWKLRVDFAWSCVVVMQQVHDFASKPGVSGQLFYDSEELSGKKFEKVCAKV